jgi:hypothetical protein
MNKTAEEYIQVLCPQLTNSNTMDVYLDISTGLLDERYFGSFYQYALALQACHLYAMDYMRKQGQAGLVTGETEGRVSVKYWNSIKESSSTDLDATSYGKRLIALRRSITPAISSTGIGIGTIYQ